MQSVTFDAVGMGLDAQVRELDPLERVVLDVHVATHVEAAEDQLPSCGGLLGRIDDYPVRERCLVTSLVTSLRPAAFESYCSSNQQRSRKSRFRITFKWWFVRIALSAHRTSIRGRGLEMSRLKQDDPTLLTRRDEALNLVEVQRRIDHDGYRRAGHLVNFEMSALAID